MRLASGTILCVLLARGCSSGIEADMVSFREPDLVSVQCRSVLVEAETSDWLLKDDLEDRVAGALRGRRIDASKASSVLSPMQSHTPERVADVMQRLGFDGHLLIRVTHAGATERLTPAVTVQERSGEARRSEDGRVYEERSTTSTHQPRLVRAPWIEVEARLRTVDGARVVWTSRALASGTEGVDPGDLVDAYARKLSSRMWDDGVVARRTVTREAEPHAHWP